MRPTRKFMGTALVARGSLVLFSKGYGFANLESDGPDSPNTKFRLDLRGGHNVHKTVKFGMRRTQPLSLLSETRFDPSFEQSPRSVQRWLWVLLLPSHVWDPKLNRAVS
jgi:hypothetical protein